MEIVPLGGELLEDLLTMLEKQDRINVIAKALYEYQPIIEQEIDTLDGSPKSPAVTITWEEVTSDYPATFEAIIEMATVAAKYLDAGEGFPQNTYSGIGCEDIKAGAKVLKFEIAAVEGVIDEVYKDEAGATVATVVWYDTGCATDDVNVNELVITSED